MVETMTQATKDRIAELERQKIELNDQLEILGYSGNLVRMHQIEEQRLDLFQQSLQPAGIIESWAIRIARELDGQFAPQYGQLRDDHLHESGIGAKLIEDF